MNPANSSSLWVDLPMLSKSNPHSYLQCARKLWLEHPQPELAGEDDSSTRRREIDGNLVGEKARSQLGDDFIWLPGHSDKAVAAEQAKLLLQKAPHLSAPEMPMMHGGLSARASALVRHSDGYILAQAGRPQASAALPRKQFEISREVHRSGL
jgi:hypothetical protein